MRKGAASTAPLPLQTGKVGSMFQSAQKALLIFFGTLSLSFGVIGIFLPVLPTTPFLLLAACCYMRSSKKLYAWLIRRKVIGVYLYGYITYRAVPKNTKIFSLIFLWATLVTSMFLVGHWPVRALLVLVGVGVSMHLLTLKTIDTSESNKHGRREDAVE